MMLMVHLSSNAQVKRPQIKIGIEAGPGLTHLRGNDYIEANYMNTIGYAAGLSLQIRAPKSIFSFKSNIFYERKGAMSDDLFFVNSSGNVTGVSHNKITLTYITIPAMLRINTNTKLSFFINVGGFVGFLLKEEDIIGAKDTVPEIKINNTANDNKLDGGFCVGAGFTIPLLDKFTASLEIRDNIGVYDINNTPRTKGGTVQTNSLNFLVGFSYLLERKYKRR